MEYVSSVLPAPVRVVCGPGKVLDLLCALGANRTQTGVELPYSGREQLAGVLSQLQALELPFVAAGPGWPPADVFMQLRDEHLVQGPVRTVIWLGPGQPVFAEA